MTSRSRPRSSRPVGAVTRSSCPRRWPPPSPPSACRSWPTSTASSIARGSWSTAASPTWGCEGPVAGGGGEHRRHRPDRPGRGRAGSAPASHSRRAAGADGRAGRRPGGPGRVRRPALHPSAGVRPVDRRGQEGRDPRRARPQDGPRLQSLRGLSTTADDGLVRRRSSGQPSSSRSAARSRPPRPSRDGSSTGRAPFPRGQPEAHRLDQRLDQRGGLRPDQMGAHDQV